MIIYEKDAEFVAHKIAARYLIRFLAHHPELDGEYETINRIFRRVFCPKAYAILAKRCFARGHEFVRGKNPIERPTVTRHKERFLRGLDFTIKEAAARLERAR